jgi:hypothetical protein
MNGKLVIFTTACLLCLACTWCKTAPSPEPYQVSKQTYDTAFSEIYDFIEKIQGIMDKADYKAWKSILSPAYINKYGDPRYLKQISEEPSLKNKGIVLSGLRDYFLYVFIPSRTGIKMDRIEFIDKDHVKVIAIVNNTGYVIYLLKRTGINKWEIGVW